MQLAQSQAAEARIAARDDLASQTLASPLLNGRGHGAERTPIIQLMALCPQLYIAESMDVPDDLPVFWDLPDATRVLDAACAEAILAAMTASGTNAPKLTAARAFLSEHLGKTVLILGH